MPSWFGPVNETAPSLHGEVVGRAPHRRGAEIAEITQKVDHLSVAFVLSASPR